MKDNNSSYWKRNGLSLALFACFLLFWVGQALTGWQQHNEELNEHGVYDLTLGAYLQSGHFLSTTFENWESEFFQMIIYVIFTIHLTQKGSAESKSLDEEEDVDKEPKAHPDAPWPVKKGGFWLSIYKNSLTLAFVFLFLLSFCLHAYGSYNEYAQQQLFSHKEVVSFQKFIIGNYFWFESFQNWQSEFLAVFSIVFLSIYLRQKGSPESKPVDAPHAQTGK